MSYSILPAGEDELRQISQLPDCSVAAGDPDAQLSDRQISVQLVSQLKTSPAVLLHPLLLRELEDMTCEQIAALLAIPVGTVMSRLSRGRQLLRKALQNSSVAATVAAGARSSAGGKTDEVR